MKIGIVQISPYLGDLKRNFDLHLDYIEKSRKKKADLLIFPELSLTGYTLKDLVEEVALNPKNNPLWKKRKEVCFTTQPHSFQEERSFTSIARYFFLPLECSRKENSLLKVKT